jgi:hypothetical protein
MAGAPVMGEGKKDHNSHIMNDDFDFKTRTLRHGSENFKVMR